MIKKYTDAIAEFNTAIKYNPNNWEAYRYKGDIKYRLEDYNSSLKDYTQATLINSLDANSYLGKANVLYKLNKYKDAIFEYTASINIDSSSWAAYFGRGQSYLECRDYEKSIIDFNKSIQLSPNFNWSYLRRGISSYKLKKYNNTISDCDRYLELKGDNPMAFYYKGISYLFLSEKDKTIKRDSAIVNLEYYLKLVNNDPNGYKFLGCAYARINDSAMAKSCFEKALNFNTGRIDDIYFKWAMSEYRLRHANKAISLYDESLKNMKNGPNAYFYYYRGLAKELQNDTLGALNDYDEALKIDNNNTRFRRHRLDFLVNATNINYNKLVREDIDWFTQKYKGDTIVAARMYSYKAMIEFRNLDSVNAFKNINRAIDLLPDEPSFYVCRAICYLAIEEGNKQAVINDLDKAISIDSTMWEAYLIKGGLLVALFNNFNEGCNNIKLSIQNGGQVSKDMENYICKRKIPKGGVPYIDLVVFPKMKIKYETDQLEFDR